MPVIGPMTPVFTYYPDSPPSILGKLTTGLTVTIELWKGDDPVVLGAGDDACEEIGNTGIYAWSTGKLPPLQEGREQYHYRMNASNNTSDEGDFILEAERIDFMPSLNDQSSYMANPLS